LYLFSEYRFFFSTRIKRIARSFLGFERITEKYL